MATDAAAWRRRRRRLTTRAPPSTTRPPVLGGSGAAHDELALRELHVTVPLRPQGDAPPANLPPTFARALQDEYATRYLARLGACATPENVAMVLKHLPLENCKLTAAWRARGALADELTIDLYPPKPTPVAINGSPPPRGSCAGQAAADSVHGSDERSCAADCDIHSSFYCYGPVCWSFNDMKRKFLPPFCEATAPASESRDVFTAVAIEKRKAPPSPRSTGGSAADDSTPSPPGQPADGATVTQILGRRATLRRQQCASERRVPPDTRCETICAMHRAFFSSLPLAALGLASRAACGSDRDLGQRLLDALVSDGAVLELAQSVVLLLYHDVFVPMTSVERPIEASNGVEALLVDCVRLFATVRDRYGAWRAPSSFAANSSSIVPMILLALRVDVETLFRMQYPQSFASASSSTSTEMHRVLAAMNRRISSLLDPDAHWSRVPVLESSCAAGAARTAPIFQRQRRRLRLRDQFFRTSEALHCVFPAPAPGNSRRIMAVGGGAQVARYAGVVPAPDTIETGAVSVESKLKLLRVLQRR